MIMHESLCYTIQEGFLADQTQPEEEGNRALMYDIADGTFLLKTFSTVKIRCEMNFRLYPFDTQACEFKMQLKKFMGKQVLKIC